MSVNAAEIKEGAAPPDLPASPPIACLDAEIRNHQVALLLLPSFRRLSTVEGIAALSRDLRDRGLQLPKGGTPPEKEAASNRARVEAMELAERLREDLAHDQLSWILCADEAHVRIGDPDAYGNDVLSGFDILSGPDVVAYVARHAIEAGRTSGGGVKPFRVRMAVFGCLMEAWKNIQTPEAITMMDVSGRLIFGGAFLGGDSDWRGRSWLAHSRGVALAAAAESETPASRYMCLAFAAAAEVDLCGAMLATELAHVAVVAHEVEATEDIWPGPYHATKPGVGLYEAKIRTGDQLMIAARQVLDDEERAGHAEEIRREGLRVLEEVDHG